MSWKKPPKTGNKPSKMQQRVIDRCLELVGMPDWRLSDIGKATYERRQELAEMYRKFADTLEQTRCADLAPKVRFIASEIALGVGLNVKQQEL